MVEMTDLARARAAPIWGPIAEEAGRWLSTYDEEQLRFARDFLREARAFLDRHRARVEALE